MTAGERGDVQHKGHEIVEGDGNLRAGTKKKRSGLGDRYGQGIGYGGYDVELDQAKSQTGTADHMNEKKRGHDGEYGKRGSGVAGKDPGR